MKEGVVKLKNYNRSMQVPFVIYADFEALNEKFSEKKGKTQLYQKHRACEFCFQVVCFDDSIRFDPVLFRASSKDEDVGEKFLEAVENEVKRIHNMFDFSKKMIFLEEDRKVFEEALSCWICGKDFSEGGKVKNHCHFTGKFREAAHEKCNLQFRKPKFARNETLESSQRN